MALLRLAADWQEDQLTEIHVFTVNHGLRAEAAGEAEFVARESEKLGLPHRTLRIDWPDGPPKANIQSKARLARYEAMAHAAQAHGIDHLLTAHTEDDQAETFLLRLARGSGVDGLSSMAPRISLFGLIILRPLLTCSRADLRSMLQESGTSWIEDPSNIDPQFARVRMRSLMPDLAKEGMTTGRLARTAAELRIAREALEEMASKVLEDYGEIAPQGYVSIGRKAFENAPREIGLRVLKRLLRTVNPRPYRPRAGRLDTLYDRLATSGETGQYTLGGCVIKSGSNTIKICCEMREMPSPVSVTGGQKLVWDHRFDLIVGPDVVGTCEVRALGRPAFDKLKREARAAGQTPPKEAYHAHLPSLWARDELISAPFWPLAHGKPGTNASVFEARFRPVRLGFSP